MNFDGASPIYYFQYVQEIFDPENQIPSSFTAKGYVQLEEKRFPGLVLFKYGL